MAIDYTRAADMARRLVSANGRMITFLRLDASSPDPAMPWRGPANPRLPPADEGDEGPSGEALYHMAPALMLNPAEMAKLGLTSTDSDLFKKSAKIFLVAPGAEDQTDLTTFHEVQDENANWRITAVETFRPATVTLLYFVGVNR